jgi:hypothetical protein
VRGHRGEPGIGKRVIEADLLKRHLKYTTSQSEKMRISPRQRCRIGSKEEEVGGARLEMRSMAKKARKKAWYKACKGREEVRSKRDKS